MALHPHALFTRDLRLMLKKNGVSPCAASISATLVKQELATGRYPQLSALSPNDRSKADAGRFERSLNALIDAAVLHESKRVKRPAQN